MKAIIQRVHSAAVSVDDKVIGQIGDGLLILLGVFENDTEAHVDLMARKLAKLRIFSDEDDKMNLSLLDIDGEALVISNFTVCADTHRSNRPSFSHAMAPAKANEYYELLCQKLKENGVKNVQTGQFGADMQVQSLNDGPVTFILDTTEWGNL